MRKVLVLALLLLPTTALPAAPATQPIQITSVVWKDAPPTLPAGSKIAVLEGDPKHEGIFTMRVKIPTGAKIAPHFHPQPERVTVIWGEARVGFGDVYDMKKMKRFPAGSFYVNPPDAHHFLYFPRTTILQMTGQGPWELHFVKE
jgi:quercetin dioxygenase-like cupin family protein